MADEKGPDAAGGGRILVLDKVFAVFDLLAREGVGLRIIDIQRGLGIPRPTVHRILAMLVEHGYVVRDESDRFVLGIRLYELGMSVHVTSSALDTIRAELEAIADELDATCYLSVRRGDVAMCLVRIDRGPVQITDYQVGETLPLTVGGGPKILLAGMGDAELEAVLTSARLPVYTVNTLSEHQDVLNAIERIRETGFAVGPGDHVEIETAIGVPLKDSSGKPAGAISVALVQPRPLDGELERIVARLQIGAARLAQRTWRAAEIVR